MYSSYTTLQRAQLAKQEYLDTQEVFLGVYAPGRNAALKASLQDQLHLSVKFRSRCLIDAAGQPPPRSPRQRRRCASGQGRPFPDAHGPFLLCGRTAQRRRLRHQRRRLRLLRRHHPLPQSGLCSLPGLRPRLPGAAAPLSCPAAAFAR